MDSPRSDPNLIDPARHLNLLTGKVFPQIYTHMLSYSGNLRQFWGKWSILNDNDPPCLSRILKTGGSFRFTKVLPRSIWNIFQNPFPSFKSFLCSNMEMILRHFLSEFYYKEKINTEKRKKKNYEDDTFSIYKKNTLDNLIYRIWFQMKKGHGPLLFLKFISCRISLYFSY